MAMATAAVTSSLHSPPLSKSAAPPPRAHHPPPPLASARAAAPRPRHRHHHHPIRPSHISSACGDPRSAVAELLRDHGATPADAAAITARSPGYAAMLADGVRELEELGLWASWSAGAGAEMGALGFGRKVYFMGRSRRDGVVVPLVESLGVRLSSAKLIPPYVAA